MKKIFLTITKEFKMKKLTTKKTIGVTAILFIAGIIATQAFAYMGGGYHMGSGYGMMNGNQVGYGNQMGYGMMGNGYMGNGYMGNGYMMENLSAENQQKMLDQMNSFFASTKEIREQRYQKQLELNKEYANPEKDQAKIETLQKELFDLSTQFEKQRFDNRIAMQKLFPDNNMSSFTGANRGYGGCF
jgi:Spy/CpxP family protein refolding chaperone